MTPPRTFETPREADLGLRRIENAGGLCISVLPNGCLFAIEHVLANGRTLINQIQGSALGSGIGRLFLRVGTTGVAELVGPDAHGRFAAADDRFVWERAGDGLDTRVTLWLHPTLGFWLWQVEATNTGIAPLTCDATLVQDIGLGSRGFVMSNEAYASQYIDHHIATGPGGPVVMSRQNLAQGGAFPWVAHGCLDGAAGFATDALQILGPAFRDGGAIDPTLALPGERLQHEVACPTIRSAPRALAPGETATWTFFGLYVPDHPEASGDGDLARIDEITTALPDLLPWRGETRTPPRSFLQDAAPLAGDPLDETTLAALYPDRIEEERDGGQLLSFFVPDGTANRHVVLRDKERTLARRHGAILRTGRGMLLDETTLCSTAWMHGVFASLLSIGNTSFHRLFSASRDPYNITRAGGLRLLVDTGDGWRLLAEPSVWENGLSDCRWIYRLAGRTITVHAAASGDDPALQCRIDVAGAPCRFLAFAGLVLGERELDHAGRVEIDADACRVSFRPDPGWLWGQSYPGAVYHLVTATPGAVEALGSDELLRGEGAPGAGGFIALRSRPTNRLDFTITGSLTDPAEAARLADRYAAGIDPATGLAAAAHYWRHVTRDLRLDGEGDGVAALDTLLPWLVQNAMIHLTVPHGLEQSGGAAWGTRDVCQGPVELLLALEHDAPVRDILKTVFAQQQETRGDWPQWFMVEPYARIRDRHSHGDVIVWPLKALCDYVETTGDLSILDEPVAWRGDDLAATARRDPISTHVDKLLATVRERFIPGTHLIRYGEGDWNDSLQPADPRLRDWMVSSWTVSLLYQQLGRYAAVLDRAGRAAEAAALTTLAAAMRADFNHYLMRDGTVAGYAVFEPALGQPELLLHPADTRTGLSFSLLPMTRSIIGGLFTAEQARHHLALIRAHLLAPDGARLMDRPVAYHGGPERLFRRAESAAFFGREIGLMYVHAHLRYGEALAVTGEADALWQALEVVNPVGVAGRVPNASRRQRNAYFSSSDAAFPDRWRASAEWDRVAAGTVAADGGWRVYSSGPGLYMNVLLRQALGITRRWGERTTAPVLPPALGRLGVTMTLYDGPRRWDL